MNVLSFIYLAPDFMQNLSAILFFGVVVVAVVMMNRFHGFDDRMVYPGTRETANPSQVKTKPKYKK